MSAERVRRTRRDYSVATDLSFDTFTADNEHEPTIKWLSPRISAPYLLPPTVPSPYSGSLETSLEHLLQLNILLPQLNGIITVLLQGDNKQTDWPALFRPVLDMTLATSPSSSNTGRNASPEISTSIPQPGRYILDEFFYFITRILLPNQIQENRAFMYRLYSERKGTYVKLLLRYDMQLPWKRDGGGPIVVSSEPPQSIDVPKHPPPRPNYFHPFRPLFYENVWATLIAAPEEGYTTKGLSDKMKHHVTALDNYLLLADGEVGEWGEQLFLVRLATVIHMWTWIRDCNETLEDMEAHGWEQLQGCANNEWFLD